MWSLPATARQAGAQLLTSPSLCSSHSGSRGWWAGWARCSCRTARPGPRPLRLATPCVAGAAMCSASSTEPTPGFASRSSSASSEVGPRAPEEPPALGRCPSDLAGSEGSLGLWPLEQTRAHQRGLPQLSVWVRAGVTGQRTVLLGVHARPPSFMSLRCPSAPWGVVALGGCTGDLEPLAGVPQCS